MDETEEDTSKSRVAPRTLFNNQYSTAQTARSFLAVVQFFLFGLISPEEGIAIESLTKIHKLINSEGNAIESLTNIDKLIKFAIFVIGEPPHRSLEMNSHCAFDKLMGLSIFVGNSIAIT